MPLKLNGIIDHAARDAALSGGADFIGCIFTPHPLRLEPAAAGHLFAHVSARTQLVGCFRDPVDAELEDCLAQVPLDYIQLSGEESPHRLQDIRQQFGLPLIKVIHLATKADLTTAADYEQMADYLIFTAKPAASVRSIGGAMDLGFDWTLLDGLKLRRPWFLGGGINADNLSAALGAIAPLAQPPYLDITSGILGPNNRPDSAKITQILAKMRDLLPIVGPSILE